MYRNENEIGETLAGGARVDKVPEKSPARWGDLGCESKGPQENLDCESKGPGENLGCESKGPNERQKLPLFACAALSPGCQGFICRLPRFHQGWPACPLAATFPT